MRIEAGRKRIRDVGARLNLSTILLVRSAERVVALKPSSPSVAFFRLNLELNKIAITQVRAVAVPSMPGALWFETTRLGAKA